MNIYVKKVKNSDGSIKESLWIRYTYSGKLYRKPLGLDNTKANMRLAKNDILPKMQLRLINGELFETKIPTVNDYYKKSFELHKAHRRETTSIDNLRICTKHILPVFGSMTLDSIKPSDVTIWQNELLIKKKLSSVRVKDIRNILGAILEDALRDEIINKNPVRLASNLPRHTVRAVTPFSLAEIEKILQTAQGQHRNFFAISFFTGMRTGELIGLKWSDVDIENKEIHIKRSVRKGLESLPKTVKSVRTIDMLDAVVDFFKNQYRLTGSQNSYLFLTSTGHNLYDAKNVRASGWTQTLKSADIEYRPLYHTRHTFATQMIQNGEDILWVSHMLGHSSPKMTLDKYAKYIKVENRKRGTFLLDVVNT